MSRDKISVIYESEILSVYLIGKNDSGNIGEIPLQSPQNLSKEETCVTWINPQRSNTLTQEWNCKPITLNSVFNKRFLYSSCKFL
jgi:hypothetical protein